MVGTGAVSVLADAQGRAAARPSHRQRTETVLSQISEPERSSCAVHRHRNRPNFAGRSLSSTSIRRASTPLSEPHDEIAPDTKSCRSRCFAASPPRYGVPHGLPPKCATPRRRCPIASRPTSGFCRLMDTKITRTVALVALLIYASGTASALCDLCPAPLLDGTLTIPNKATLQLKASTQGGDATLTGPLGAISGRFSITCQSGEFNAMFYGMSDSSLYRCLGTIDGRRFTGHCVNGSVTGEISGRFLARP